MSGKGILLIWQNSSHWGGVDVLTLRFSAFLRARGIVHRVVQREGSKTWNDLPADVRCTTTDAALLGNEVTRVLLPSVAYLRDKEAMQANFANARVLCWVVHPLDVLTGFFPFVSHVLPFAGLKWVTALSRLVPRHYRLVETMFTQIIAKRAMLFMDGATRRQFDAIYPALASASAPILPIPSPAAPIIAAPTSGSGALRVGYLGRIDRMKWSALGPLITNSLAPLARDRRVTLLAITEGAELPRVQAACTAAGVTLDQRGYMPIDDARSLLCRETDVVVAMGTSALDIASASHPVILIDPAFATRCAPQRLFRFAHEVDDCTLGEFRDSPGYIPGLRSFEECVQPDALAAAGPLGAEHVRSHHGPERIFSRLLEHVDGSECEYRDLAQAMRDIDRSFARLSPRYALQNRRPA